MENENLTEQPRRNKVSLLLIFLVFLLVVSNAATVFYYYTKDGSGLEQKELVRDERIEKEEVIIGKEDKIIGTDIYQVDGFDYLDELTIDHINGGFGSEGNDVAYNWKSSKIENNNLHEGDILEFVYNNGELRKISYCNIKKLQSDYYCQVPWDEGLAKYASVSENYYMIRIVSAGVDFDRDGLSDVDEINMYKTDPRREDTDDDGLSDKIEVDGGYDPLVNQKKDEIEERELIKDLSEGRIEIEWKDWAALVKTSNIFGYQDVETDDRVGEYINSLNVYEVGKILTGDYQGNFLYIVRYPVGGRGGGTQTMRIIKNDNKNELIVLQKHNTGVLSTANGEWSEQSWGGNYKKFRINENIEISNLSAPESISVPDSNLKLIKKDDNSVNQMMIDISDAKKIFEYKDSEFVYLNNKNGCFIVQAEDSTVINYILELDFIGKEGEPSQYAGFTPSLLDVVWNSGEENEGEYIFQRTLGCGGGHSCLDYANYIKDKNQLKKTGQTKNGDSIYELVNDILIENECKGSNCKGILQNMHDGYYPGWDGDKQKEKISYEEFLNSHPLVFWEDPFGNFIKFQKADYMPAVECGKPVIYLYPEEEIDVSVQVEPSGGLTITEPNYGDGWLVKAKPNGEIYNYGDGQIYPYLFWEGHGVNYTRPEKGFVVKRGDVEEFLINKLSDLGLIKNEYDEFIEYWQPKMTDSPYYLVNFVSKEEFDKIAPLTVEPEPDTIIRVFMDYQGLEYPIQVEEPEFITPERIGFTVVEWGGALNR